MRAVLYFLAGLAIAAALALSVLLVVRSLPDGPTVPPQPETVVPARPDTAQAPAPELPPAPEKPVGAAPAPVQPPAPPVAAPIVVPQAAVPPTIVPPQVLHSQKPRDPFDLESLPSPGYIGPGQQAHTAPRAAAPRVESPAPENRAALAAGRLNPTAEQTAKLRYVLLSHTIVQSEAPEFPLRIGGTVPPEVSLMPLPREVADAIPGYANYSYVISQYQIVIVITERREIDLLIPAG
jgi:hypothetical protein